MFSGISPVSSMVSFILGILYSSIIFLSISSSSSFFVGTLLKTSSPSVPKIFNNLSPSSKLGIPTSGISYKKSSISFLVVSLFSFSLDPAIKPIEPNKLFPIFQLSMLGSTNGLFPEITSKSFFGGGIVTLLVNGMF